MKKFVVVMLLLAACKTAPPPIKEVPASALEDHWGDSRRDFGGTCTANGRRYDEVRIELPNGEKKVVYFDITENWNHPPF